MTGYPDLLEHIATCDGVEAVLADTRIPLSQFAGLAYFLRYWCIPFQVPARQLLEPGDDATAGMFPVFIVRNIGKRQIKKTSFENIVR